MLKYECAVVLLTSPAEEETQKQVETVKGWLTAIGAEISDVDLWGRKRLAYPIRKQLEGMYVIFYFELADGTRLRELERRFRTAEFILRHLLVRLPALKEYPRIPREEPAAAAGPEEAGEPEAAEGEGEEEEAAEAEKEIELEAETPRPEGSVEPRQVEEPPEPEQAESPPADEEPSREQPAAGASEENAPLEAGEPKENA